jgi:acetoin utilization deacetylase AcuC-like enzyme
VTPQFEITSKVTNVSQKVKTEMLAFYDPIQKSHFSTHEIIDGRLMRHHEKRARIDVIMRRLKQMKKIEFKVPNQIPIEHVLAVHDELYVKFLAESAELAKDETIWPYVFPCDSRLVLSENVSRVRAGQYCFDVGTPIMRDTWPSALAAASGAFAAAQHTLRTKETTYALARPPGHHSAAALFGGYCYLNNAAIAAKYLSKYGKVLILDFDFHHGNGTQSIFYDSSEVFYLSTHGDPEVEYPYFSGFTHERGIDDGLGFNLNVPLAPKCGSAVYLEKLKEALDTCLSKFKPEFFVVSCGFDIADGDPLGHFGMSPSDFNVLGTLLRSLNFPTVLVQEGGYLVEKLGENVASFIEAWI